MCVEGVARRESVSAHTLHCLMEFDASFFVLALAGVGLWRQKRQALNQEVQFGRGR